MDGNFLDATYGGSVARGVTTVTTTGQEGGDQYTQTETLAVHTLAGGGGGISGEFVGSVSGSNTDLVVQTGTNPGGSSSATTVGSDNWTGCCRCRTRTTATA